MVTYRERHGAGGNEEALTVKGGAAFVKAPNALAIVAAPLIGLLYAVALPFIGIAVTITVAMEKVVGSVVRLMSRSASFGWRPEEAYLAGKKKKGEAKEERKHGNH